MWATCMVLILRTEYDMSCTEYGTLEIVVIPIIVLTCIQYFYILFINVPHSYIYYIDDSTVYFKMTFLKLSFVRCTPWCLSIIYQYIDYTI